MPKLICPECGTRHDMMKVRAEDRDGAPVWWCPGDHEDTGPFEWSETLEPGYTLGDTGAV